MNTQMVPHDTSGPSLSNIWSYLVTDTSKESGFEHASLTSHPASESGSLFFWMIMSTIPPFPHRQGSAVNNKGGVLNMLVLIRVRIVNVACVPQRGLGSICLCSSRDAVLLLHRLRTQLTVGAHNRVADSRSRKQLDPARWSLLG